MPDTTRSASFVIDWQRVQSLADVVASLPRVEDFPARVVRGIDADDEDCLRGFLFAAAICHSTHGGLRGMRRGQDFVGWDYLLEAFSYWAESDPARLGPDAIVRTDETTLKQLLAQPFDVHTITLDDLGRRASILSDVGRDLEQRFGGSVTNLLADCAHRVGGASGAYALISTLPAFADPLEKKTSAFLMAVHFSGRWEIRDQENVRPMIDYHRMRLLLRTGCIVSTDVDLSRRLRSKDLVDAASATTVRELSMEICSSIPQLSGMAVFDFDVLLWALARSCCRHRPLCVSEGPESDSFYDFTGIAERRGCVLSAVCPGASDARFRSLWEPQFDTEDY